MRKAQQAQATRTQERIRVGSTIKQWYEWRNEDVYAPFTVIELRDDPKLKPIAASDGNGRTWFFHYDQVEVLDA